MIPVLAQEAAAKSGERLLALLNAPEVYLFGFRIPLPLWAVLLIVTALGLALHFLIRSAMRWQIRRSAPDLADRVLAIFERLLPIWLVLALGYVGLIGLELTRETWAVDFARPAGFILWVASLFWAAGALVFALLERWAERSAEFKAVHAPVRFLLKVLVVVIAAVTILAYFKVDITALVATGAVGGVAVAFALKDTLENFFAGLHLMADRPINEDDVVQIPELNERGTVIRVGWRSTRIRTLDNNLLIVPNMKLATGTVINMSKDDPRITLRTQVGVAYGTDADRVGPLLEQVVRDLAGKVPGVDDRSEPRAFLHPGFGASSLDFTLRYSISAFDFTFDAQDAVRREILRRFEAEGIRIPFPTTRILYDPPASGPPAG